MPNEGGTLGERLWGIPEVTGTAPEKEVGFFAFCLVNYLISESVED